MLPTFEDLKSLPWGRLFRLGEETWLELVLSELAIPDQEDHDDRNGGAVPEKGRSLITRGGRR